MFYGFCNVFVCEPEELLKDSINDKPAFVQFFAGHKIPVKAFFVFVVNSSPAHGLVFLEVEFVAQICRPGKYQTTVEIRRLEGGRRHTPIIAMTASALDSEQKRCREMGMDDFISKPVEFEQLKEVVGRWLDNATSDVECDS